MLDTALLLVKKFNRKRHSRIRASAKNPRGKPAVERFAAGDSVFCLRLTGSDSGTSRQSAEMALVRTSGIFSLPKYHLVFSKRLSHIDDALVGGAAEAK